VLEVKGLVFHAQRQKLSMPGRKLYAAKRGRRETVSALEEVELRGKGGSREVLASRRCVEGGGGVRR
jgi:hypothetical protein